MKKMCNKVINCFLLILSLFVVVSCSKNKNHVERNDWADDVKEAINDFLDMYGKNSKNYENTPYVVFDFDNTTSIFDVEQQTAIHQLKTMSFEIEPSNLSSILSTGLSDLDKDLTSLGYGNGSYNDWIEDICDAYNYLYDNYGPFNNLGLSNQKQQIIQQEPYWLEFSSKMMGLYNLIDANESSSVAYPWITYWFTGMSEDEVYNIGKSSHTIYKDVDSELNTWVSPSSIESNVGVVSISYTNGISVTENIKELWKTLYENGIDVWVCSASPIDVIKAAIDVFGLHDYCKGVIAMTNSLSEEKYINSYDYTTGYYQLAIDDNKWEKGTLATKAQTQGEGKVTAINNSIYSLYGYGPIAGFMDSTGDFNFCTEYKSLKLVVCFNRANRSVCDGGGLIAEIAMYEKDSLKYNLKKANKNNDTLYVLQGRNENNKRSFVNSNKTYVLGSNELKLFKNSDNETQLNYIISNKMSVSDALNKFALATNENDSNNVLGFNYGFLKEYSGYHSI